MMKNPFKGATVEHVCLPSTHPKLTAEFLARLGGEIIKEIPGGAIFCLFGGQIFELNYARNYEVPPGKTCHIAIPFPSSETYTEAVAWMKGAFTPEEVSFQEESEGTEVRYALVVIPGAVTLQPIFRAVPLRPAQATPSSGNNPEC
ncbi:MAG: hypothetical protein RIQ72_461 [Candidatus Parcubacteria bacterium]|jgi:hypothetical protein